MDKPFDDMRMTKRKRNVHINKPLKIDGIVVSSSCPIMNDFIRHLWVL